MTSGDYSQPEFYRFNQDSIELVRWILRKVTTATSILDLGAGSGVIGLELSRTLLPECLTLLELQDEFEPHLLANVEAFLPKCCNHQILIQNFSSFAPTEKFELIVCNPPYYLPGRGELSSNPNRAQARSFIVDSWSILLKKIAACLSATGLGFIVLKIDDWLFEQIKREASACRLQISREDSAALMFLSLRLDVD